MKNECIREELKKRNLKQWELAKMLGVSEFTLTRRLREELPEEEKKKILEVIEKGGTGDE